MINKILKYISDHRILSLAIYFSIFLLLVIGFVHVADEVLEGETLGPDKAILYAINGIASPFLNTLFVLITELGGVLSMTVPWSASGRISMADLHTASVRQTDRRHMALITA